MKTGVFVIWAATVTFFIQILSKYEIANWYTVSSIS